MSGADAFDFLRDPALDAIAGHPLFAGGAIARHLRARPLGFADVGARGGAHPLVLPLARHTRVLGFEADAEDAVRLAREGAGGPWAEFRVEPVALAGAAGPRTLHLLAVPTNHSLLPPNEAFTRRYAMAKFAKIGELAVDAMPLDAALAALPDGGARAEFLKLDTQGTEHEILEGARATLARHTLAVFCEVEFCEVYAGQKTFTDVDALLRDLGFAFYGFTHVGGRSGKRLDKRNHLGRERAMWADAVFFKDPLPGSRPQSAPADERHRAALAAIAALTGFFDFALELAATFENADERDSDARLIRALAGHAPARAAADARSLAAEVARAPDDAAVAVARFVDRRRSFWDAMDVPQPPG